MSRLSLEGRSYATEGAAVRRARKVIGDRDVRWFVAFQDGRFWPVAIHRDGSDVQPLYLAQNGITVVN